MSLNYRLLLAAQAAGATATDLGTAIRQALVLGGATPSTTDLNSLWASFLGTQGYTTGSLSDRLAAYLADKGYSGSLNDMLLASATAGDLFINVYPLSFSALGLVGNGFVLDGKESEFLKSVGGAASGNGDVIGQVTDVSGNEMVISQGTGANKPTNTVTGGVNAITLDTNLALAGTMPAAFSQRAFSFVAVLGSVGDGSGYYPFVFPGAGYDYFLDDGGAAFQRSILFVDGAQTIDTGLVARQPRIVRVRSTASASLIQAYTLSGTLLAQQSAGAPLAGSMGTAFSVGLIFAQTTGAKIAFAMLTDADIDDAVFGVIKTDLIRRFGSWS